jgi:hypothetical protein
MGPTLKLDNLYNSLMVSDICDGSEDVICNLNWLETEEAAKT